MHMTAEQLKALLSQPLVLLLMMAAASIGSSFKQATVSKRATGVKVTLAQYFVDNWPETLIMVGHNLVAFVALLFTDTLNPASALGAGYVANDAADIWTKHGRSAALGIEPTAPPAKEEK